MNSSLPDPLKPDSPLYKAVEGLAARWGWFVGMGVVMLVLGFIALGHVVTATLASVFFVGALMLVAGFSQLIHAWQVKGWQGFMFWTLSGILYGGAGVLALIRPEQGASLLTLLLGATLIGTGALRLWLWFNNRTQEGWQWMIWSGLLTLATGLMIAIGWPDNSVWVLGLILSIDLVFQGWTVLFIGLALKKRHQGK